LNNSMKHELDDFRSRFDEKTERVKKLEAEVSELRSETELLIFQKESLQSLHPMSSSNS